MSGRSQQRPRTSVMSPVLRSLHGHAVDAAYRVYWEAFEWLKRNGVRQWLVPTPRGVSARAQKRGDNFGLFVGNELAVVFSLRHEANPHWREELGTARRWWLSTLATAERFRGRKLGERAVEEAWVLAQVKGAGALFLDCVDARGFLPAFYRRLGYSDLARKIITYPSGNSFPMVLMRKTASGAAPAKAAA